MPGSSSQLVRIDPFRLRMERCGQMVTDATCRWVGQRERCGACAAAGCAVVKLQGCR